MPAAPFKSRYRSTLAALNQAYAAGDEAAFDSLLGEMRAARDEPLLTGIARLSQSLSDALARLQLESRVAELAGRDMPDARHRLDYALRVTEDAAHRTLDLIEQTAPLAEATVHDARRLAESLDSCSHNDIRRFLRDVQGTAERVRTNLSEVMLAQGYQDLTGQLLHGVRSLIVEVEAVLDELAGLAGVSVKPAPVTADTTPQGPAVPGVTRDALVDQRDVDDLFAGMGR